MYSYCYQELYCVLLLFVFIINVQETCFQSGPHGRPLTCIPVNGLPFINIRNKWINIHLDFGLEVSMLCRSTYLKLEWTKLLILRTWRVRWRTSNRKEWLPARKITSWRSWGHSWRTPPNTWGGSETSSRHPAMSSRERRSSSARTQHQRRVTSSSVSSPSSSTSLLWVLYFHHYRLVF